MTYRNRFITYFTVLCLSSPFLTACANEAPANRSEPVAKGSKLETQAPIAARVESAFSDLAGTGFTGVVAVHLKDGRTFYRGFAGPDSDMVPDRDTLIDTASITKTFTAAAVMTLVEAGIVTTDTTLAEIFSNVPADKAAITVHQLLTHSAGFPVAVGNDPEPLERDAFLDRAMNSSLRFEPGSSYSYSNVGYALLAAMIEIRTGQSYENYLRRNVLQPVGIENIGYQSVYDRTRSLVSSTGGIAGEGSWGGDRPYWNLIGNGGLLTSLEALVRYRQVFRTGNILSPSTVDLMQTPYVSEGEGSPSYYGYGLVVQDHPVLGRFYWHNGGGGSGFSANWTDYTDKGLLVIAASGKSNFSADDAVLILTQTLLDIDLGMEPKMMSAGPDESSSEITANARSLADEFLTAMASDREEDWKAFLLARGAERFIAYMPMENHMSLFKRIHEALKGFSPVTIGMAAPDEIEIIMTNADGSETKNVYLGFMNEGEGKFSGYQVE